MTEFLIEHLIPAIKLAMVWGLPMIFILMAIESSVIPLPSEVVMIPAGFMAARGELMGMEPIAGAVAAVAAGGLGSLAGALICYWISLWLGRPILHRYGKYFFLKPTALDRAEEIFREYGTGAVFIGRLMPAVRHLISIPAGLSRMKLSTFTWCTLTGATLWCAVLTVMGYWFGAHTREMSYEDLVRRSMETLHHYKIWILIVCILALWAYVWVHKKIMHGGPKAAA